MKTRILLIGLLSLAILASASFLQWRSTRAQGPAQRVLRGSFSVTIFEGPSVRASLFQPQFTRPVILAGILTLRADANGAVTGELTPDESQVTVVFGNLAVANPRAIAVAGQISGRAVNLVLDLGNGKHIFGVGTATNDVFSEGTAGIIGGPATGPAPGDRGDWASPAAAGGMNALMGDGSVRFIQL